MRKATRPWLLGLACLAVTSARAQDAKPAERQPAAARTGRLEDIPPLFVPLHPRTAEEQSRVESLRLYAVARALEDRHQIGEALDTLEKARKLNPESAAILRQVSRLNLVLGRTDEAVAAARKLIEIDPGDPSTITLLVAHYLERKNDPAGAEGVLKKIAADPHLSKTSAGYFVLLRTQGDLYADLLNRPKDAADVYEKLLDALDEKAANGLSPRDRARVLEGDEAASYLRFGEAFLKAGRPAPAIRAFRRGLLYNPEHAVLPRHLAEALYRDGKPAEALEVLEAYLRRQPAGGESYELLTEILDNSGRKAEALPRLEAAAKADPKNLRLQFLLVDRLREEGQGDRADAMLANLLKDRAEPQVYAALAQSYKKAKKTDELLKVLVQAFERRGGLDAVRPTVESLAQEPALAGAMLDAAAKTVEADPAALSNEAREQLLVRLVVFARPEDRTTLGEKLAVVDRAALKGAPNVANRKQFALDVYYYTRRYDEAVRAFQDLFEHHPSEKTAEMLYRLSGAQFFDGKVEPAIETAKQARAIDPTKDEVLSFLGYMLSQVGRDDEAIEVYEEMLRRFGNETELVKKARSGLSTCYINKGDLARGESELEKAFREDPDDAGLNNDLGYLYAEHGKNLEQAEAMIRKALKKEPENGSYLDSLGWVLYKQGKVQEALEPLERAAKSERNDLTICEHLGDVYFRLKDLPHAREYWTKAEEFGAKTTPPAKRLAEIRKKLAELEKLAPASKPPSGDGP